MKRYVKVSTQKEFFHCWPTAPDEVAFLRTPHRHMLHMYVTVEVTHNERDIEFILLKREVEQLYLEADFTIDSSCETVAEYLLTKLRNKYGADRYYKVEIYEDNENGAILEV